MLDKQLFSDELTDMFIGYQWRLDKPMPSPEDTKEAMILKYHSDPMFRSKVQQLVAGVMLTLDRAERSPITNK